MKAVDAQAVPSYLRELNERRVLDALRLNGSAHAAEVARLTGLSRPTAAQVLRSLMDVGLVQEELPNAGDPKRARSMYTAVSTIGGVLSLDIGARFIRAAIADLNGVVVSSVSRPHKHTELNDILAEMHGAVDAALADSNFSMNDVVSLVVGSPGVVDRNGTIAIAGTINALDGLPLADILRNEFNIEPVIENDVNLVAYAESTLGEGQDVQHFAVVSVGSGIGAGLILDGKLHRGHRGAAGEIFYVPFGDTSDSRHIATDPSGPSIERLAEQLAAKYPSSRLSAPYESVAIFEAARYKDQLALAVVEDVAERIARYIATITAVLDIELVILGGGVGRQADVLLAEIQAVVARIVPFAPEIRVSTLGDKAILLGGIALGTQLAQDKIFAERSNAYQAARDISEVV